MTEQVTLHGTTAGDGVLDMTSGFKGMQWEIKVTAAVNLDLSTFRKVTVRGDFTNLPFKDEAFQMVLFDPPHTIDSRNTLLGTFPEYQGGDPHLATFKYGCYRTIDQLRKAVYQGAREAARVLKPDGVLVFKWSDSEKPFSWAHDTVRKAARTLEPVRINLASSRAHSGNLTTYIWYKKTGKVQRLYES